MTSLRITELAEIIASETAILNRYLGSNGLPEPSFSPDAPIDAFGSSPDIQKAKSNVIEATIELRQLLEGPVKLLLPEVSHVMPNHFIQYLLMLRVVKLCSTCSYSPFQDRFPDPGKR
jgi:hypothetical protein